jgi:hypothetical protein
MAGFAMSGVNPCGSANSVKVLHSLEYGAWYLILQGFAPKSGAGIATCWGLDGRGSIPGKGKRFSLLHSVQTGSGAHPGGVQWVPVTVSSGLK